MSFFGGAAALFERAFRRVGAIFDCFSDSAFHALNSRSSCAASAPTSINFFEQLGFHCCFLHVDPFLEHGGAEHRESSRRPRFSLWF
jgi:hypothetical protein